MALDEVAVICPIDLPAMLADAAGKGTLIMPVAHGVSQLEDRWGKPGAATVWATCGTKLLLPGISDPDTLENVSRLCGSITTGNPPNQRTERVVPPELLRTLPGWRALVVRMNLSPAVVKVRPVWKRPERRFPLRYLLAQPALPRTLSRTLPLMESGDLPGTGPALEPADDLQPVPVPSPQEEAWPSNGTGQR